MTVDIYNKKFSLPTLPQPNGHRYAKNVFCQCGTEYVYETYVKTVKNWQFDGIYNSHIGDLICFTCPECGDRFMFHCNFETWFNFGFFDKFEIK